MKIGIYKATILALFLTCVCAAVMVGPALRGVLVGINIPHALQFGYFIFDNFSVPFFAAGFLALIALAATITWVEEPPVLNADMKSMPFKKYYVRS